MASDHYWPTFASDRIQVAGPSSTDYTSATESFPMDSAVLKDFLLELVPTSDLGHLQIEFEVVAAIRVAVELQVVAKTERRSEIGQDWAIDSVQVAIESKTSQASDLPSCLLPSAEPSSTIVAEDPFLVVRTSSSYLGFLLEQPSFAIVVGIASLLSDWLSVELEGVLE